MKKRYVNLPGRNKTMGIPSHGLAVALWFVGVQLPLVLLNAPRFTNYQDQGSAAGADRDGQPQEFGLQHVHLILKLGELSTIKRALRALCGFADLVGL